MKIKIINGPNLNMLGIREPEIYGKTTYKDLVKYIKGVAKSLKVKVKVYQSNCEGEIVSAIQKCLNKFDAIVINPAGYTHTSVAILDALKAVSLPAVEVHLSNMNEREDFRKISFVSSYCEKTITGLGIEGYKQAIEYLVNK